jgi:hypothetical protein
MHVVLSVIFIAGIIASVYWAVTVGRPNYRKINRLERRLGMHPSYDLSRRRRSRSRGGRS